MSATLVSSNTTIKVNGAVSASSGSSANLYTAPSNGYAIVNLTTINSTGTTSVTVGTRTVQSISSSTAVYGQQIYIGPSQVIAVTVSATGSAQISGVEFVNTP